MHKRPLSFYLIRIVALLPIALVLVGAAGQVQRVAWGTGNWLGEYSLKWGMGFFLFVLFCLALFALAFLATCFPHKLPAANYQTPSLLRWPVIVFLILAPVWLFQYTYWGMILTSLSFRVLVWGLAFLLVASILTRQVPMPNEQTLLISILLTGSVLAAAIPLVNVTSHPFSLEWSEGNRLWDYSTLFGRGLYIYPADQPLVPFLDFGRQLIGGLPFLLPNVTIAGERLWVALVAIVPYLLLGWSAFAATGAKRSTIFFAGMWAFLFLRQGPIHAPLVISAILVALAWRRPLWVSLPAIMLASWFASVSRFTWMFAPGMWTAMLVLAESSATANPLPPSARTWGRAILLGVIGAASGYFLPQVDFIHARGAAQAASDVLLNQSLLWYRLLPNSTYDLGVLVNLSLAALPLVAALILLAARNDWPLSLWQKLALVSSLLAFLVIGLIASTKIGGGADLHNLDMFLIGALFVASLAWPRLEAAWKESPRVRHIILLMAFLPALFALRDMQPLLRAEDLERLKVLTGRENMYRNDPNLLGLLPSHEKTERILDAIRNEVAAASQDGEVLFMDQRQLLTFGFVETALVPEYDKKYLMDRAMTDSFQPVFRSFYADLAARRFALIVTDPLRRPDKGAESSFGEENNAWVKWVAAPILCFYIVKTDLDDVRIQLLVPRGDSPDCALPH
ncbi:MAG: hypothetical protein HFACDABA_03066 [Anaerolineales bacterium]|nr:hypothetical protein [Anaerolineales bacterium]